MEHTEFLLLMGNTRGPQDTKIKGDGDDDDMAGIFQRTNVFPCFFNALFFSSSFRKWIR